MNILFLDTETDGLPPMKCRDYLNPKKFKKYPRLIELNWVIVNDNKEKILVKKNKICPKEDIENINLKNILLDLNNDIKTHKIKKIIGYNVLFHYHMIISESYRVKNGKLLGKFDVINHLEKIKIKPICCMKTAIKYFNLDDYKYPKLDELFYLFFKKQVKNKKLMKNIKCYFKLRELKKNEELKLKYASKYIKYVNKLKKIN